ncbi:MAG: hypothetical protein H6658_14980 [Ardenticatenaceae bacterium]|nr:hypothetical protein [Ardenticatenaceae bacterium]
MTEKRSLSLILLLFILLGVAYAVVTPAFEASDELWHYPMIRHLADGNPLPVQVFDPALAGPWKQEASQPPLYYYLGAALTFWIDTADMEQVRWLNPHVDNGVITADGNINLAIHDPAFNQWQGTLLAVHIVRIFSVLLGVGTVYLTYRLAKLTVPERPDIALGAAAMNGFTPMFLFISGAVNNDNLAVLLASWALVVMVMWVVKRPFAHHKTALFLGSIIGLGILTKEGTFGLLPLAFGTIFIALFSEQYSVKSEQSSVTSLQSLISILLRTIAYFAILLVPVLLIAGWWYYRNIQLYGDWLGWNAFIAVLGQRAHPASVAQLWDERWGFLLSYWGLFGGVNVPMWTWIYRLLNGVLVVGVVGFVVFGIKETRDWRLETELATRRSLQSLVSNLLLLVRRYFGLVVCLLFSFAVIFGLVQWARTTWSSQGRLVFTAISALNVLLAIGLAGWLPQKVGRWVLTAVSTFLFLVAAAAPFLWIRPAYQPQQFTSPWLVQNEVAINFDDKIRLVGYEVGQTAVAQNDPTRQPGDTIDLMLEWEMLQPMARNWSVFVHVNDPVLGRPIAQRDMYLDQGLRPTSLLQAGERVFNYYQLRLPETAVAPADLELTIGLYDYYTFERLPLVDGGDAATIAHLQLEPVPGDYPNPVQVNFEDELELVGFEVTPRHARPGEQVNLTLYWQAKRPLTTNYTFFAQIVDLETTTRYAAQDLPQTTSSWLSEEVQTVEMVLTIAPNTPPDVYPLILGAYTQNEGRLQMMTADGRLTDDFLILTPIRVDE